MSQTSQTETIRVDTCGDCRAGLETLGAVSPPGPHEVALGGCDVHRDAAAPQATHVVVCTRDQIAAWQATPVPSLVAPVDPWVLRHSLLVAELASRMLGPSLLGANDSELEYAVVQARRLLAAAANGAGLLAGAGK